MNHKGEYRRAGNKGAALRIRYYLRGLYDNPHGEPYGEKQGVMLTLDEVESHVGPVARYYQHLPGSYAS